MFPRVEGERKSERECGAGKWPGDCSVADNQVDYLMLSVRAVLRIAHADKQTESADGDAENCSRISGPRRRKRSRTSTTGMEIGLHKAHEAEATPSRAKTTTTKVSTDLVGVCFQLLPLPVSVSLGKRSAWKAVPTCSCCLC